MYIALAGLCVTGAVLLRRAADRLNDLGIWLEDRGGVDPEPRRLSVVR